MSLIEGIGDEVVQFFAVVFLVLIIVLAWWSTGYSSNNERRLRSVVIMERNVRRLYRFMPRIIGNVHQNVAVYQWSPAHQNQTEDSGGLTVVPNSENVITNDTQSSEDPQTDTESIADTSPDIIDNDNDNEPSEETANAGDMSPQEIEMNQIVDAMESATCTLRNRRLSYFSQQQSQQNTESKPKTDNIKDEASTSTISQESKKEDEGDSGNVTKNPDNIRIRLKYLNEDQKLVEGCLQEPLGEFKRRHFRGEISARKLVRLIFNGQILQTEAATLGSCGLFDNCVVHCLVHQPRTPGQVAQMQQQLGPQSVSNEDSSGSTSHNSSQSSSTTTGVTDVGEREERDWDLSHILLTILASILSIAWYCHIRFSNLFGVAASVAMLGLTALYVFAVICVYYPEAASNEGPPIPTVQPQQEQQTNNAN